MTDSLTAHTMNVKSVERTESKQAWVSMAGRNSGVKTSKHIALGRAIHGPIPVSGETFDEPSGPWVHTHFSQNENKAPRDWSIRISNSPEVHTDQRPEDLSESSRLHRHRSIESSSGLCGCSWQKETQCEAQESNGKHLGCDVQLGA